MISPGDIDRGGRLLPQTTVDVDLGVLARNVRALKGLASGSTRFMAVVKANAYGHGAVPVAKTALANGADFLAVARISEAVTLRQAGIDAPVLLFGDVLPDQAAYMAANDIRATITDIETARTLSAGLSQQPLKVHIKIDTGMGRLGFVHSPHDGNARLIEDILAVHALDGLDVEGIYTHLSKADERDKTHAREQIRQFRQLLGQLAEKGFAPKLRHAANSAGLIELPESHFDMVRPGIALYGLRPSPEVDISKTGLEPVMRIRSKIIQVKQVPKGFGVSYGATHVTPSPTTIATIPIGYADGYSRQHSNCGIMLVRGQKAGVVGRVCMDFTMIDVGHIAGAAPGDEVVIMGVQEKEEISADIIAELTNTINYEVTAGLTGRMPRRYLNTENSHDI
ncbi:MAG: alanine racemase [Desulfobacterales bacterium]|nr:alanine racemase [Desulfobacterales bacterium]